MTKISALISKPHECVQLNWNKSSNNIKITAMFISFSLFNGFLTRTLYIYPSVRIKMWMASTKFVVILTSITFNKARNKKKSELICLIFWFVRISFDDWTNNNSQKLLDIYFSECIRRLICWLESSAVFM